MKKKILIIGGGIHGISCAMSLSALDCEIMLIEKNNGLFLGTSGSTHNRAHMGYHYPRADGTVKECLDGLKVFQKMFKDIFIYPNGNYYMLSKTGSMTTDAQFEVFCKKNRLPYELAWPAKHFLKRDGLSSSFLVPEMIFDVSKLIRRIRNYIKHKNIIIKNNTELLKGRKKNNGSFHFTVSENGEKKEYTCDIVVNATYAFANNILKAFGLEQHMKRYLLQIVEVAVVRSRDKIPGLTIMDGPFISIMPYGNNPDLFLVYDVENSVNMQEEGYLLNDAIKIKSNWKKMKRKGQIFFPFMNDLEYVDSLRAFRPIPLVDDTRDRSTKIRTYDDCRCFYSILEGKFISALLMAEKLKNLIVSHTFI